MKILNKIVAVIVSVTFVFSCGSFLSVQASASGNEEQYPPEINESFFSNAEIISADLTGVTLKATRTVSQLTTRGGGGELIESISLKCLPDSEENAKELLEMVQQAQTTSTRSNSNYRTMAEKSGAGTLYSTVYFERYTDYNYNRERAYIVHATGGYSQSDSTVSWYKNTIGLCQQGKIPGGSGLNQTHTFSLTVTRTFDSYPPSGWQAIFADTGNVQLGVQLTTTCGRGSSRWDTTLDNWAIKT